ncbi:hypothetical protein GCM10007176_13540 [Salinicoccus roseus]|nr:hypothetical protein EDC33_0074 [Salinicoccus roseus]GGA70561.1 hypothetical protein GCM10007176_13540 [Salinicoccus roseus]
MKLATNPKSIFGIIIIFSIGISLFAYKKIPDDTTLQILMNENIFDKILNLIGITFGFFSTILAILLSNENILVKRLRTSKNVKIEFYVLISYIIFSSLGNMVIIVLLQILNSFELECTIIFPVILYLVFSFYLSLIMFLYVFVNVISSNGDRKKNRRTMGKY